MHNKIERVFAFDNLIVAVSGVVLPFAVGYPYASYTGGSFAYSMFVAAALTATSVGVTVAILKEFKQLQKRFAEIIIGAAVLDDLLGLLVLSFFKVIRGCHSRFWYGATRRGRSYGCFYWSGNKNIKCF
jgi:Kef-type K+ transport system membrane component KefB